MSEIIRKIGSKQWMQLYLPHVIGLLFITLFPLFIFETDDKRAFFWLQRYYYQLAFTIIAFYVNYLYVVPRYYFKIKRFYFFGLIVLFAVLLVFASNYTYLYFNLDELKNQFLTKVPERLARRSVFHPKMIEDLTYALLVLGFSTGLSVIQILKRNELKQKEKEKAHLDTELAFLKNQVSPHFFFNSLNNIYALVAIDADQAQKSIEKLSGLMRYLIYETDIKTIGIEKEFEFTGNYIDLMRQRLSSKVKLEVQIDEELPVCEIPPLLFIPFVENAFKHGVSYRGASFIEIQLRVTDQEIVFTCRNSIANKRHDIDKKGGFGIKNIQKRLDLLFGEKANLQLEENDMVYEVYMRIPLKMEEVK